MSSPRCLFNPSAALRRVFLPLSRSGACEPALPFPALIPAITSSRPQLPASSHCQSPYQNQYQIQTRRWFKKRLGGEKDEKKKKYKLGRFPQDDEIEDQYVILKIAFHGPDNLSAPQPTRALLRKLDMKLYSLRTIAIPSPDNPEAPPYPICQIVDRKVEANAQREQRKELRRKEVSTKTVQINWAIDPHDLGHRMRQVQTFLNKGLEVQVVLMPAKIKRKRRAGTDEMQETLDTVEQAIAEVPGTKETRKRDGAVGATLTIFLKGPKPSKAQAVGEEEEGEGEEGAEEEEEAVDEVARVVHEALGGKLLA